MSDSQIWEVKTNLDTETINTGQEEIRLNDDGGVSL